MSSLTKRIGWNRNFTLYWCCFVAGVMNQTNQLCIHIQMIKVAALSFDICICGYNCMVAQTCASYWLSGTAHPPCFERPVIWTDVSGCWHTAIALHFFASPSLKHRVLAGGLRYCSSCSLLSCMNDGLTCLHLRPAWFPGKNNCRNSQPCLDRCL
jgi:hypothetical protein